MAQLLHSKIVEHELPEELVEISTELLQKSREYEVENSLKSYTAFMTKFEHFTYTLKAHLPSDEFLLSLSESFFIALLIKMLEKFIKF